MKKITNSVFYAGVNDHKIDLFEGQYIVPNGMAYNSYVIVDEKIAVFDTVDKNFNHEWLDNVKEALNGKSPDYLIISHMEPDHSANVINFLKVYPETVVVGNVKTFTILNNFFRFEIKNKLVVADGDTLSLGSHELKFVFAPMVHWPEVMMTYEASEKLLFSADAFGKFGALDVDEEWACEARRYYFGIVGKYGVQVQSVLKKLSAYEINKILPLHGPILTENLGYYLNLYDTWSSYGVEADGVFIAYTSVYGNTKVAVEKLVEKLKGYSCPKVAVADLAREDMAECVEDAFKYGKIVLASTTYNSELFPFMNTFVDSLTERNYQNRKIGIIENGSWAPMVAKNIKEKFAKSKNITFVEPTVKIISSLSEENLVQIDELAKELTKEYVNLNVETRNSQNLQALNNIGYGLYAVTCNDGEKDNAFICNSVTQLTSSPLQISVCVDKSNYSYHVINKTGKLNVNCLSENTPFKIIEKFGFVSGRAVDKFKDFHVEKSVNGLAVLSKYVNSFISLKVEQTVDLGTHAMFICSVEESVVISDEKSMTYAYYHEHVKPKPETEGKKGYVCKICGYVHEGEDLPDDFICPLCKHGAVDFEKIG